MIRRLLALTIVLWFGFLLIYPTASVYAQEENPLSQNEETDGTSPSEDNPYNDEAARRRAGIYFVGGVTLGGSCGVNGNSGGTLPGNIPAYWRDLISNAATKYPNVDPRMVAVVLYVENNGWPDPNTAWRESDKKARGPFQFLPETWMGWDTGIKTWDFYADESKYGRGMGTDGDGDGIRDPNNPRDAVEAAFKHHVGSTGLPIAVRGYNASATFDQNLASTVFENTNTNLLYYARKYNGSGAANGTMVKDFQNGGQNSEYVLAAFTLLASNFTKAYDYPANKFIDVSAEGTTAGDSGSAVTQCATSNGVSVGGYSFPVGPQKKSQNGRVPGMSGLPCNGNCHHDGTPALDLSRVPGGDSAIGTPVFAISDGEIRTVRQSYQGEQGCQSLQLKSSKDNYWYAYIHIQSVSVVNNQRVSAGQQIGVIGERRCTGNGSSPHLHIDRGCVQNGVHQPGGRDECRDDGFIELVNGLYERLPD